MYHTHNRCKTKINYTMVMKVIYVQILMNIYF